MNYTYITKDFDLIIEMVRQGKLNNIGIDWVYSLFTWSWVFYYKYEA